MGRGGRTPGDVVTALPLSGGNELARGQVASRLPCQDPRAPGTWYADKLGLHPVEERPRPALPLRRHHVRPVRLGRRTLGPDTQMGWKGGRPRRRRGRDVLRGVLFEEPDVPACARSTASTRSTELPLRRPRRAGRLVPRQRGQPPRAGPAAPLIGPAPPRCGGWHPTCRSGWPHPEHWGLPRFHRAANFLILRGTEGDWWVANTHRAADVRVRRR